MTPGVVAVCCHELSRFASFSECLGNLRKPAGVTVEVEQGMDVALNRRAIVRRALERDVEWVLFIDDDMLFKPDLLLRLLAHDLPVVGSLYFNRNPAFYAMAFNQYHVVDGKPMWAPVTMKGAPASGLVEVLALGTGGLLVKTEVFRAIPPDTWFIHGEGTEDLPFCQRVIEAGYKIYLDLEVVMGHISTYAVWPTFTETQDWKAGIQLTKEHMLLVEIEG